MKKIKNYLAMLAGLWLLGLGIALVTQAELGTTAISSLPYVLSFIVPLSFGTTTFILNVIYVGMEIALLRKQFPGRQYLQFLMPPLFGGFIDSGMYLFRDVTASNYFFQLALLVAGCLTVAAGVCLMLEANVLLNPGEGIVQAIAAVSKRPFEKVKVGFDVSLVALSVLLSFLFLGQLEGVREGTVLSALLIGPMIQGIRKGARRFFGNNQQE